MVAIVRRMVRGDGVSVTLSRCEGLPLYASFTSMYPCAETAKRALGDYGLVWYEPFSDADPDVLWIGETLACGS
ncbi:MAG TPA: hypothetical protein VFV52_08510 [Bacilli bacterium]|nr:hypothetical protein [Bacilli bacterium]